MEEKQLKIFDDVEYEGGLSSKYYQVPFVDEVQEFNDTFGKPNNYKPTIGNKKNGCLFMILSKKN